MKKLLLITLVALLASCSKPNQYDCPTVFKQQIHTEDMSSLIKSSNNIQIVLAEDVDGRQTYNVLFPDGTVLDSMYPEEIANGLVTGKWDYNEDLQLNNN